MTQLDCVKEHRDMNSTYILWVLDDGSNVVFLHKELLNNIVYGNRRFIDWLMVKPHDECCRMISRTLLASLRYKPAYVVLVGEDDSGAPYTSGFSMNTMLKMVEGCPTLQNIRAAAEGYSNQFIGFDPFSHQPVKNLLGHRLSELCVVLSDRGFFSDPRNRVKYGKQLPKYNNESAN